MVVNEALFSIYQEYQNLYQELVSTVLSEVLRECIQYILKINTACNQVREAQIFSLRPLIRIMPHLYPGALQVVMVTHFTMCPLYKVLDQWIGSASQVRPSCQLYITCSVVIGFSLNLKVPKCYSQSLVSSGLTFFGGRYLQR